MADLGGDVVDLTDNQGPIACEVAGIKIVLRRIQQADLPEIHRLMLAVPWPTTLEDVEDCFAVRRDCQFGAFLMDEPSKTICKFIHYVIYRCSDKTQRQSAVFDRHRPDLVLTLCFSALCRHRLGRQSRLLDVVPYG